MEVKINRKHNQEIKWPKKCAICGANATSTATATSARGTGYYVVAWTEKIHKLNYPICNKHKFKAWLLDIPGKLGFVRGVILYLFSGLLSLPFLFLIGYIAGKQGIEMAPISNVAFKLSYLATALFYFYARFNRPITLKSVDSEEIIFDVKNASFADEFNSINRSGN